MKHPRHGAKVSQGGHGIVVDIKEPPDGLRWKPGSLTLGFTQYSSSSRLSFQVQLQPIQHNSVCGIQACATVRPRSDLNRKVQYGSARGASGAQLSVHEYLLPLLVLVGLKVTVA